MRAVEKLGPEKVAAPSRAASDTRFPRFLSGLSAALVAVLGINSFVDFKDDNVVLLVRALFIVISVAT